MAAKLLSIEPRAAIEMRMCITVRELDDNRSLLSTITPPICLPLMGRKSSEIFYDPYKLTVEDRISAFCSLE